MITRSRNQSGGSAVVHITKKQVDILLRQATGKFGEELAEDVVQTVLLCASEALDKGSYTGDPLSYWNQGVRQFCREMVTGYPRDNNAAALRNSVVKATHAEPNVLQDAIDRALDSKANMYDLGLNPDGSPLTLDSLNHPGSQDTAGQVDLLHALGDIGFYLLRRAEQSDDPDARKRIYHWLSTRSDNQSYLKRQEERYAWSRDDLVSLAGLWLYPKRASDLLRGGVNVVTGRRSKFFNGVAPEVFLSTLDSLRSEPHPKVRGLADSLTNATQTSLCATRS